MATVIKILSKQEISEFDSPPEFDSETRKKYFRLNSTLKKVLEAYSPDRKAGFLLQLGYFRETSKFFRPSKYKIRDCEFILKKYGWDFSEAMYTNMLISRDRKRILDLLNFLAFSTYKDSFRDEIKNCVKKNVRPRRIIEHLMEQLQLKKVEIPNYYTFSSNITDVIQFHEKALVNSVKENIPPELLQKLDLILEAKSDPKRCHAIFKTINHSCKPKKIRKSVTDFEAVETLYQEISPVIETLNLPTESIRYYATWATKSRTFQLKQFSNSYKRAFYLITFVAHQYFVRQDTLIDLMMAGINSRNNKADKTVKLQSFETKKKYESTVKIMIESRRSYREIVDQIKFILEDPTLCDADKVKLMQALFKTKPPETPEQMELFSKLETMVDESIKGLDYFDILETMSTSYQNRASSILKVIRFNKEASNPNIIEAITHYQEKKGRTSQVSPSDFLLDSEKKHLFSEDGKFKNSLYKVFFIQHVFDAIKSGELSLVYSYKYLSLDEYLIPKKEWLLHKKELLKQAGLESFSELDKVLIPLRKELDFRFIKTNQTLQNKSNAYVRINKKGSLIIETPKETTEDPQTKVSTLFESTRFVSILKLLSDVNQVSKFTDHFDHFSMKHSKGLPSEDAFIGGIVGLGCNIGIHKMSRISKGLTLPALDHVMDWYFSLDNIQAANVAILKALNTLELPDIYVDGLTHTSSDTMRCGVTVDTIYADRSLKYFKYGMGVKLNSFLDPKSALFYSHVINSSEGEAPYLLDAFLNNDVVRSDIHSTDTHGYSEAIFAATHFCNVYFAPRIKNIQNQSLYSFLPRAHYAQKGYPVLPKQALNEGLLRDNWDDLLRLMVTIKLKYSSASQIFKRLNSYSKNPLYMALKEFGRVIKSIFVLRYIDDVELRQKIDAQLNKSELSNKFSRAVRFANNQEFNVATREEQNIADACRRLIQNAIVFWNYLYLSEVIVNLDSEEKKETVLKIIREGSIMCWSHINLHGEYIFLPMAQKQAPFFDVPKIMGLKIR